MKTLSSNPEFQSRIERQYWFKFKIKELEAFKKELKQVECTIPAGPKNDDVALRMERAIAGVDQVIQQLKAIPTLDDLQIALSLSIETANEKKRCSEIGTGTVVPFHV